MPYLIRRILFALLVRPVVLLIIGLNLRGRRELPQSGPAVIVANHNSHLDTLVLLSLLGPKAFRVARPVAASDYFTQTRWLNWMCFGLLNAIGIDRTSGAAATMAQLQNALERGEILILYPEGTRGEPEALQELKGGVAHLARSRPGLPIFPVFMHGLGKALPKGDRVLVPFICDVFCGKALHWNGKSCRDFTRQLSAFFEASRAALPPGCRPEETA